MIVSGKLSRVGWWVKVGFAELYYYYPRGILSRVDSHGKGW
jgi:hypothetical protein